MNKTLEELFNLRNEIETEYGPIKVVDIATTFENEDATPILLSCGWSETLESIKETIFYIAETSGRRVIAVDYTALTYGHPTASGLPRSAQAKAVAFLTLFKKKDIPIIDAIAHSEGAINIIAAAEMSPVSFRKITLIAPAGMMTEDDFFHLAVRFLKNLFYTIQHKKRGIYSINPVNYTKRILLYFLANPVQTFTEAFGIARFSMIPLVKRLQDNGKNVEIILSSRDTVFPCKNVDQIIHKYNINNVSIIEGGHNEFHENPALFTQSFFVHKFIS